MRSIFIVEDHEYQRNLYAKWLHIKGFSIIDTAINGEQAVNKFKNFSQKPDIILMDYIMPVKNGLEAAQEILAIDNDAKIVLISNDHTVKKKALSLGIRRFEAKPINIDRLTSILRSL